jgi:hypothetical protein
VSELESKIKSWLDDQGYPLEMRVACAFRRAGFRVLQSEYYADPTSGVQREIDVVAHVDRRFEKLLVRIEFVVECKSSKSKPWVMFCASDQRLANPARVAQRTASEIGSDALLSLAQRKDVQDLDLFSVAHPPAYGITQAFTSGADVAYAALTTVAAAAAAAAIEADQYSKLASPFAKIVFPAIAIEGKLFSCVLQDDASISVSESQHGTLLWRNQFAGEPHTIVTLLVDGELSDFAGRAFIAASKFLSLCESEMLESLHGWNDRQKKPKS